MTGKYLKVIKILALLIIFCSAINSLILKISPFLSDNSYHFKIA